MLAGLPAAQVRALYPSRDAFVQRQGCGPTSLAQLRSLLSGVRARGYAVEEGTVTPDFSSVAAAVLDHRGHPVAAFALTFEGAGVVAAERLRLATAVSASADALSGRLGRGRAPG